MDPSRSRNAMLGLEDGNMTLVPHSKIIRLMRGKICAMSCQGTVVILGVDFHSYSSTVELFFNEDVEDGVCRGCRAYRGRSEIAGNATSDFHCFFNNRGVSQYYCHASCIEAVGRTVTGSKYTSPNARAFSRDRTALRIGHSTRRRLSVEIH